LAATVPTAGSTLHVNDTGIAQCHLSNSTLSLCQMACGTCRTCNLIAVLAGEITPGPGPRMWSCRVQVDLALLEKSAGNGCLTSRFIQQIVQAGKPGGPPSRVRGPVARIGIRAGAFCVEPNYWQEGDPTAISGSLFPFAVRGTSFLPASIPGDLPSRINVWIINRNTLEAADPSRHLERA